MKQRLHKVLAQRGIASRRAAEEIIATGRIAVNGTVVTVLGTLVEPEIDEIRFDGQLISPPRPPRVLMLNKPTGYISSCRTGREIGVSVLKLIPNDRRYFPVGRLDRESSGMLILTDDGDLAFRLTHPRHKAIKYYEVECDTPLPKNTVRRLTTGVLLDDGLSRVIEIKIEGMYKCRIALGEGRKRQIRRMFSVLGLRVSKLHRMQIGGLKMGDLPIGRWRELNATEITALFESEFSRGKSEF